MPRTIPNDRSHRALKVWQRNYGPQLYGYGTITPKGVHKSVNLVLAQMLWYVDMNQIIKRAEEVKKSIEIARRTEGFTSIKTSVKGLHTTHIYDVDMMQIRGMPVCDLEYLANGFVDLCGPVPYKQRNLGLGKCIVSAPIMLFVEQVETQQFVEALQLSCASWRPTLVSGSMTPPLIIGSHPSTFLRVHADSPPRVRQLYLKD